MENLSLLRTDSDRRYQITASDDYEMFFLWEAVPVAWENGEITATENRYTEVEVFVGNVSGDELLTLAYYYSNDDGTSLIAEKFERGERVRIRNEQGVSTSYEEQTNGHEHITVSIEGAGA